MQKQISNKVVTITLIEAEIPQMYVPGCIKPQNL